MLLTIVTLVNVNGSACVNSGFPSELHTLIFLLSFPHTLIYSIHLVATPVAKKDVNAQDSHCLLLLMEL